MLGQFFSAQEEIDLENIGERTIETLKRNPFKITGGVSASTVFYGSNVNDSRDPFTYFLNGNLNLQLVSAYFIQFYKSGKPVKLSSSL